MTDRYRPCCRQFLEHVDVSASAFLLQASKHVLVHPIGVFAGTDAICAHSEPHALTELLCAALDRIKPFHWISGARSSNAALILARTPHGLIHYNFFP